MIHKYTTPYHDFILPFTVDKVQKLYITYSQNNQVIIEKEYPSSDIQLLNASSFLENSSMGDEYTEAIYKTIEDLKECSILTIHLSQEDTSQFHYYAAEEKNIAYIQIRLVDHNNNAYVSHLIRDRILGTLKEGVI